MAADAEIQDYFKKISKTYENIQHYLDCANNAVIRNNAIDQEDEKKNIDKPLRVHNSNDINHLMADLEYVFPSNIQMCDLFNDPKEIVIVGDELRKMRIDKKLTQHQVAES